MQVGQGPHKVNSAEGRVPGINPLVPGLRENVLVWSTSKPRMLLEDSFPSINISTNQWTYQEAPSWLSHLGGERVHAPWEMSRCYRCICDQKAREVKFWESITLDLEFSKQLRKSLQIPRREERVKGFFLEYWFQSAGQMQYWAPGNWRWYRDIGQHRNKFPIQQEASEFLLHLHAHKLWC